MPQQPKPLKSYGATSRPDTHSTASSSAGFWASAHATLAAGFNELSKKFEDLQVDIEASGGTVEEKIPLLVDRRRALQHLVITRDDFIQHIRRKMDEISVVGVSEETTQQQVIRYLDQYLDAAAASMDAFPSEKNMTLFARTARTHLQGVLIGQPKIIRDTVDQYLEFREHLEQCRSALISCFTGQRDLPTENEAKYRELCDVYQKLLALPEYKDRFPTLCAEFTLEKVVAEYHDSLSAGRVTAPRTSYGTCE